MPFTTQFSIDDPDAKTSATAALFAAFSRNGNIKPHHGRDNSSGKRNTAVFWELVSTYRLRRYVAADPFFSLCILDAQDDIPQCAVDKLSQVHICYSVPASAFSMIAAARSSGLNRWP